MAYEPTDPESFEEDAVVELDVEAPEGDTVEQHADLSPDRDDPLTGGDSDRASEADLIEQARVVSIDEDDYR